jgi:hypothetical protein
LRLLDGELFPATSQLTDRWAVPDETPSPEESDTAELNDAAEISRISRQRIHGKGFMKKRGMGRRRPKQGDWLAMNL